MGSAKLYKFNKFWSFFLRNSCKQLNIQVHLIVKCVENTSGMFGRVALFTRFILYCAKQGAFVTYSMMHNLQKGNSLQSDKQSFGRDFHYWKKCQQCCSKWVFTIQCPKQILLGLIHFLGWFKTSFEDDLRDFKLKSVQKNSSKKYLLIQSWKSDMAFLDLLFIYRISFFI